MWSSAMHVILWKSTKKNYHLKSYNVVDNVLEETLPDKLLHQVSWVYYIHSLVTSGVLL